MKGIEYRDLFNGGPVIYRPPRREADILFAQMCVRHSIAMEIERDADAIWQGMLKTDIAKELVVADLDYLCSWWFAEGSSEHIQWRAQQVLTAQQQAG